MRYQATLQSPYQGDFVFGEPRLVFFEPAQAREQSQHPTNKKRARGWHYETNDGREVYDQLNLAKTGLTPNDLFPHGAVVLARPFIHKDQASEHPIIHWSIQSESNIDTNPSKEIEKILCWNGRNYPPRQPRARQLTMDLRP